MAGAPKTLWSVLTRLMQSLAWSLVMKQKFKFFIAKIKRDDLLTLCQLITSGKITPVIDRRYPLTETAAAIAYLEEGHASGKVIITVG